MPAFSVSVRSTVRAHALWQTATAGGGVGCTEAVQTREKMGGRRAWDTGTWIKRRRACYTAYDDDDDPIDERTNELKR